MGDPRKHHYLPQFYLRGFSVDRKGLFQIEKASGKFFPCQIKDAAAIRDFHEIDHDETDDPYLLEKNLAELESLQATILNKVLTEGIQSREVRQGILSIILMLRMRVPAVKNHIEETLENHVRATALLLDKNGKFLDRPKGLEDALKIENIKFSIMNWKCLEAMFLMGTAPLPLKLLSNMRITLYHCPFGAVFATSDQPFAIYHPKPESDPYGVGLVTPEIEISIPLSNRILIKLDHRPGIDREKIATTSEITEFNRRTIVMAYKYVFTGESEKKIADQVIQNSHKYAGFKIDNINLENNFIQMHSCIPVSPDSH